MKNLFKNFFQWFIGTWHTNSDWPGFTYKLLGGFAAFELFFQIVNRIFPTWPLYFLCALAVYILIACPAGYISRYKPKP